MIKLNDITVTQALWTYFYNKREEPKNVCYGDDSDYRDVVVDRLYALRMQVTETKMQWSLPGISDRKQARKLSSFLKQKTDKGLCRTYLHVSELTWIGQAEYVKLAF